MSDLTVKASLKLVDDFTRPARGIERAQQRLSASGNRHFALLQRSAGAAGRALDGLGNRFVALASGAAAAATVRYVGRLDERMTRLGIQSGKTGDEIDALKDRVFELSRQPEIRIDPIQLLDAVDVIVEKTGDLDFARSQLENIGLLIQATGALGRDAGALVAEFFQKFRIEDPERMIAALDTVTRQGKAGAFTLANLASQGERLAAAYAATGRTGPDAVREIGAAMQMIRQGTGSAEQATTAFEALLRTLQDSDKLELLRKGGIQVFEPGEPERMRSVVDLLTEIVEKTKGDPVKLSRVFDAEAMRAFNAAAAEFKTTGAVESLQNFLALQGDGSTITADSARAAETFTQAWGSLTTAAQSFADTHLTEVVRDLADAIGALDADQVDRVMTALAVGAGALAGLSIAAKGIRAIGGAVGAYRGLGGGARVSTGVGAMPVVVTNWPPQSLATGAGGRSVRPGRRVPSHAGGAVAGVGAGTAGAGAAAASVSRSGAGLLARTGGYARGAAPVVLLMGGLQMADALQQGADGEQVSRLGGSMAGAAAGAAVGAAAGSVVPLVGTAIGGIAGGIAGGLGGEELAAWLWHQIGGDDEVASAADGLTPVERRRQRRNRVRGLEAPASETKVSGKVEVEFRNPPPGMQVRSVRSDTPDFEVSADSGPTMVYP